MIWEVNILSSYNRGKYLEKLRKKEGWSQQDLAERIGRSRQTVNKNENNDSYFSIDVYMKLSKLFDVSIDDLIYGGRSRDTKLRRFVKQPIETIDLEKVPKQPDGLGNTLLDYVIELDDMDKFNFFYKNKLFIECLHNHVDFLCFLIRNNQYGRLSRPFVSYIDRYSNKRDSWFTGIAEFPVIDFCQDIVEVCSKKPYIEYKELNKNQKKFIDTVLDTKSKKILDLMPYELYLDEDNKYPFLFRFAIQFDKIFVFKYYLERCEIKDNQKWFDEAIRFESWTIAKYLFENYDSINSVTNLIRIKDTKYKKLWKDNLIYGRRS